MLWNTIEERGKNAEDLPEKWSNPVYPLYRLPRPFHKPPTRTIAPITGKPAVKRAEHDARERTIIRIHRIFRTFLQIPSLKCFAVHAKSWARVCQRSIFHDVAPQPPRAWLPELSVGLYRKGT
jgi:hypothetical protein